MFAKTLVSALISLVDGTDVLTWKPSKVIAGSPLRSDCDLILTPPVSASPSNLGTPLIISTYKEKFN